MGRPPAHTVDDFVDAAVRLFAAGGARAVTMTSVAREVGAPSGSVYHRFADRPALLSAVWLRTVLRFQQGYAEHLSTDTAAGGVDAAVAASGWVVDWCRDNVAEAVVLHAGPRAFSPDTWPEAARTELKANDARRDSGMAQVVRTVCEQTGRRPDEVQLALVDLPLAVVRRYLERGAPPPPEATDLVTRTARLILSG